MKRFSATLSLLTISVMIGCDAGGQPPGVAPQVGSPQYTNAVAAPAKANAPVEVVAGEATTTRNIYFVYDGSGSMGNGFQHKQVGKKFPTKLAGANWAVHQFMETVSDDVNLGLTVFDGRGINERVPLGPGNRQAFLSAVDAVHAASGTPLGESIVKAAQALEAQTKKQLGYGEYRIVVVTDGEATGSPVADAVAYATKLGFPVYTIGLDVGERHELRSLSRKYFAANSAEELKKGLTSAAAETETFDSAEFK